jgi:hypothetical protein
MLLAALLCYVGFTALCLSMSRHYTELTAGTLSSGRRTGLKVLGGVVLLLSLWSALMSQTLGVALIQWCAALMGSAVLLVFTMSYWPGLALSLAGLGLLLSPFAAFTYLLN